MSINIFSTPPIRSVDLIANKFYLITTLLDISVDQFFFPCNEDGDNNRRKQVDVLLNDMEEKELIVMEATAQGLKKARETAE